MVGSVGRWVVGASVESRRALVGNLRVLVEGQM